MFFFPGQGGRRLLGMIHAPSGPAKGVGVLYCHPFAEEKNLSHASVVKAARALAAEGFHVMRFDHSGCGDSEGDLEEASVEDWLAEIALAADLLKSEARASRIGYWGLRSGANLAWHAALARGDSAFLLLWSPVPGLKTYITQFLRQKLGTEIAAGGGSLSVKGLAASLEAGEIVEVMGYPLAARLYRGFLRADLQGLPGKPGGPVFFATVGETEAAPAGLAALAEALRASGNEVEAVHVGETPFWDRYWRWESPVLAERTTSWAARQA